MFLVSSSVVSFLGVKRQRLILLSFHSIRSGADLHEVFLNYIYCFGQDFTNFVLSLMGIEHEKLWGHLFYKWR